MQNRILIVEDEPKLREVLSDYFIAKGDIPVEAANGEEAIELYTEQHFDAILLDIMMPGLDGFSVCRAIRRESDVPIIFLTALSDEDDKLFGYELGADDYITKPYTLSVLYAKVTALINRSRGNIRLGDRLEAAGIMVVLSSQKAYIGRQELNLTPKEFALLKVLMQNKNLALSREQLLVKCWGYDFEGEARAVDTQIGRLREKLGDKADCIKTVIKIGYRLEG